MMHTSAQSPATRAALFALVLGLMRAGANVGDHIVQASRDAVVKGATDAAPVTYRGRKYGTRGGRAAALRHSVTYTATQAAVIAAGARALGVRLPVGRLLAALVVTGGSHYLIDRREPLRRFCEAIGKSEFYNLNSNGINGSYLTDQAAHDMIETLACLLVAAR
ncbi:hypothetical protein ACFV1L_22145 [Kitasatospora sp. NPDC059646]|uniref:hypothetical protein n=1 Tax=Kitasatospora sp. NPDC059646 TaxID=3346893 RepID=UPI0036B562D5